MGNPPDQAQKYLNALEAELDKDTFDDRVTASELSSLKVLARSPQAAPCVYCKDGLSTLAKTAFRNDNTTRPASSLEAARIIANALLLQDQMQQVLADLGCLPGGRILFLLTYKSKVDFVTLIESQSLVDNIDEHLSKHVSLASAIHSTNDSMNVSALVETLKLLYNLASKFPTQMHFFSSTTDKLIKILTRLPLPQNPLSIPTTQILNALAMIDWPSALNQAKDADMAAFSRRLIENLDCSVSVLQAPQLETALVPLLTVLRKVKEVDDQPSDELLRSSLLPRNEERNRPLGESQSLASRLLKLQTSTGSTILPEAISGLLFDLSDRDAMKFVHNIGYGHAAGYLMAHKIVLPEGLAEGSISDDMSTPIPINPVTGQRLDTEEPAATPEMTDAERQREAERLFVLFERLKATGVVDVENPLRSAQQSGRFEELSDSEPD
ncbi:hypothetical protein LTR51_001766 [Lithohypha guttulata]|nr:hypothetical protein LTR51_001766 [Lithohypha guttulata]